MPFCIQAVIDGIASAINMLMSVIVTMSSIKENFVFAPKRDINLGKFVPF